MIATYIHQILKRKAITGVERRRTGNCEAGLRRIRPCVMTTVTTLVPILLATGRGPDVAGALAIPVFRSMLVDPLTSFIVPTLYCAYMRFNLRTGLKDELLEQSREETGEPIGPHPE